MTGCDEAFHVAGHGYVIEKARRGSEWHLTVRAGGCIVFTTSDVGEARAEVLRHVVATLECDLRAAWAVVAAADEALRVLDGDAFNLGAFQVRT